MKQKQPMIAAKEKGPGPGRYALPPAIGFVGHDFTKTTSPAYSFPGRMSTNLHAADSSPGPQYYIDAKMTRFGRDGTPAFSMLGRGKDTVGKFQTPGPGAYNPESAPSCGIQRRAPSYTMGSRTRYRCVDSVPAPNRYTLPSIIGSYTSTKSAGASYSITGRAKSTIATEDKAPGPGRYNAVDPNIYLQRQPAYSIIGRHVSPNTVTHHPGPGAHSPEKVTADKPRPPAFSLGIRHSEFVMPLVAEVLD